MDCVPMVLNIIPFVSSRIRHDVDARINRPTQMQKLGEKLDKRSARSCSKYPSS